MAASRQPDRARRHLHRHRQHHADLLSPGPMPPRHPSPPCSWRCCRCRPWRRRSAWRRRGSSSAPATAPAVVTLHNNAAEPVMVQVQTFAWPHGPATADLEPTRDLFAVPPVFELAGNGRADHPGRPARRGRRRARAGLSAADHRGAAWRCREHRGALRAAAEPAGLRHPAGAAPQAGLVGARDEGRRR